MKLVLNALEHWGGIASTRELAASGVDRQQLDIAVMYGRIVRIKRGLWAHPSVPATTIVAHRAGGRLACVSALAYHGVIDEPECAIHISAPDWVSKWRSPRANDAVVRHWSRRAVAGDRFAVTVDEAWAQFALCRAVAGRDVRLRRTDSL